MDSQCAALVGPHHHDTARHVQQFSVLVIILSKGPSLKHNARILARNRASRAKQYVVRSSSEHHNFSSLGYKPGALARHPKHVSRIVLWCFTGSKFHVPLAKYRGQYTPQAPPRSSSPASRLWLYFDSATQKYRFPHAQT